MDDLTRRGFLTGSAGVVMAGMLGGTSSQGQEGKPETLKTLLDRGEPEVYGNRELMYIGLPVGGCFAGTVYLGGDGQLWNWDIFNQGQVGAVSQPGLTYLGDRVREQDGANYVRPSHQVSPFRQRFDLFTDNGARPNPAIPMGLSVKFGDIRFRGQYPIGRVEYRQGDSDVEMDLEAFSPFCPLDIDSSSYPATTMTFTVRNVGNKQERCSLRYEFENPVLYLSRKVRSDFQYEQSLEGGLVTVGAKKLPPASSTRADLLLEDWRSGTYGQWVAEGTAFGSSPQRVKDLPSYMGDIRAGGEFVVNTHQTRNGENVVDGDAHQGSLSSPVFVIDRKWINIRIGGGAHKGGTCINLVVDGKVVRSLTGNDSNLMVWKAMSVSEFAGREARLIVVDKIAGGWGQIGIGEIIQSDVPAESTPLDGLGDFGEFGVRVIGGAPSVSKTGDGFLAQSDLVLEPGQEKTITFLIAWRFPNKPGSLPGKSHWYAAKWPSVKAVLKDLESNWPKLQQTTRLWTKTWYDSTLPYWFLDRTFVNTSTLATTTCHRLDKEGRFYFWEGIGCCPGTCTHVWGYAQAIARIFPEVENYLRDRIDFGEFFHPSGQIDYRGEYGRSIAHDGQISCVLRCYREHLMSKDSAFLKRNWPKAKAALQLMISQDKDRDGVLEGAQYNTLDAAWYGPIAWISSLYVAGLRAGEAMAVEMGDAEFASECRTLAQSGTKRLETDLFNGEYFINLPDPAHRDANNTGIGCHIDQIYGQFWAHQLQLPRVVSAKKAKSAMAALFKHSFYPNIWDYRRKVRGVQGGRWYAMPGEGGLIMCTFPRGGAEDATGKGQDAWAAAYFNECMSGFEYQAASTMISEGLVKEGLTVIRAIHERYHARSRNPYNEVECSDHYGRAMASFGAYIALTGMHIDSPRNIVSIAPKFNGGKARCAFVDAHGWGTIDNASGTAKREYLYRA